MDGTRRGLVAASLGAVAGTAGCLGLFGNETGTTEPETDIVFRNNTDDELTLTVKLTRPLGWTPSGTATRTDEEIRVVTERDVTAGAGERETMTETFSAGGRYVVDGELGAENDPLFADETSESRRFDAEQDPRPVTITTWYIEDSPAFDRDLSNTPRNRFYDVVIRFGDN